MSRKRHNDTLTIDGSETLRCDVRLCVQESRTAPMLIELLDSVVNLHVFPDQFTDRRVRFPVSIISAEVVSGTLGARNSFVYNWD